MADFGFNPFEFERLKALMLAIPSFASDTTAPSASVDLGTGIMRAVNKASELQWLRTKLPSLNEENLKDDNNLIKHLSKSSLNRDLLLKGLSSSQKIELNEALQKQAPAAEEVSAQPVGEVAPQAEQVIPPSTGQPTGGMPSMPTPAPPPRQPRYIVMPEQPQVKTEAAETMEGKTEQAPNLPQTTPGSELGARSPGKVFQTGPVNSMKNIGNRAALTFQGNIGKHLTLNNLGKVAGAFAKPAGPLLGGAASSLGSGLFKGLNMGINAGQNITNHIGGIRSAATSARSGLVNVGKSRAKWVILGMLLFGFAFGLVVSSNSTGQPVSTSQLTGIPDNQIVTVVGNVGSCQFIRSDQNPKAAVYQSSIIMSYFQEASNKSGIPVVVLAAFTRVESPSLAYKTNNDLDSLECAVSDTGALGIMQLQPQGTKGHDQGAITRGASFIGKQYNELTREDYCNPQKNILMGAGFILKKMSYFGYGDGARWDQNWTTNKQAIYALVEGYYGCLKYGAKADVEKGEKQADIRCDDPRHKYNYGDDVWNSIQNCQVVAASCPVLGGIISTQSYQASPTNGHCSPGYLKDGNKCREDCEGGIGQSRRAKAIDVPTNGKYVQLPTLNGEKVQWTLMAKPYEVTEEDGGGYGYTFATSQDGNNYYLDMLHLNASSMQAGMGYNAGDPIATAFKDHVHMTIGKNIKSTESPGSKSLDCDPGWLPSDFMCK